MGKTKARFKVVTKDKGWKDLMRRMQDARGAKVKVGVLGTRATEEHEGGVSNGDLAFIHEFGAPGAGVPARSFIRAPFDKNRIEYLALLKKLLGEYYRQKMTLDRVLGLVGARISADFKKNVMTGTGIPPPLAPATIRRKQKLGKGKGGVRALVDTGRMVGSITWQVITRSGVKEQ